MENPNLCAPIDPLESPILEQLLTKHTLANKESNLECVLASFHTVKMAQWCVNSAFKIRDALEA